MKKLSFIQFDLRKGIFGAILAIVVFFASLSLSAPISGALLAVGFLLFGFIRIVPKSKWPTPVFSIFWTCAILAATWFSTLTVINSVIYLQTNWMLFFLNAFVMLLVCGVVFVLTAHWSLSVVIGAAILELLSVANGLVYQFRGKELLSFDVLSFATAMNVVDQYSATITASMFFGWALWALALFAQFSFPPLRAAKPIRVRIAALILVVFSSYSVLSLSEEIQTELWDTRGSVVNGYYLNFLLSIRDSAVEKPDGYSAKNLPQSAEPLQTEGDHPNIIVIMNEAFSDFRVFGGDLNTNIPVLPYYDALMKESVHGYALASIFGGNTSNSEFEFLTGHTMAFLPTGSVAYQQFIQEKMYALPHLMNTYGYHSIATHPYHANGWSRKRNYPLFGFAESTFLDSYPNEKLLRTYVSDQEMYEFMLEKLENKESSPLFLFGVSMQNHGGYGYTGEDFVKTISLTDYPEQFPRAEQYLSSLHESDNALRYLIEKLRDYPEDTVVLMFGDHLPRVENALFEALNGGSLDTLEEQMEQYSVPFFIWANYDLEEQVVEHTSLNYLVRYLLDAAGLDVPPYYRAMQELEAVIPAINSLGYYSAEAQCYRAFDEATPEEADALSRLAGLQYNNLFDFGRRNEVYFGQFLKD